MSEFYEFLNGMSGERLAGVTLAFLMALYIIMLAIVGVVKHISRIFVKPKCKCEKKGKEGNERKS